MKHREAEQTEDPDHKRPRQQKTSVGIRRASEYRAEFIKGASGASLSGNKQNGTSAGITVESTCYDVLHRTGVSLYGENFRWRTSHGELVVYYSMYKTAGLVLCRVLYLHGALPLQSREKKFICEAFKGVQLEMRSKKKREERWLSYKNRSRYRRNINNGNGSIYQSVFCY